MHTLTYTRNNRITTLKNLSKPNLSDWIAWLNYKNITYIIK